MNRCRLRILPLVPVLVAPFVLLSPVLFTGKALFWGIPALQFVPWRSYAWDILTSGHLPLWNPLLGMGAPLMANYQLALFYPPNWLYFPLDALGGIGWSAWGQAFLVAIHLAWAGAGMAYLVRKLGLGVLAQTIAGLAFGLSGYIVSRSGFLSINAALAWLPWVILAAHNLTILSRSTPVSENTNEPADEGGTSGSHKAISRFQWDRLRSLATMVIVFAMQLLAGHAQTTWYTLILAGMWVGFMGWVTAHNRSAIKKFQSSGNDRWYLVSLYLRGLVGNWVWLASAFIMAFALAALQMLPTIEYLLHSQRSNAVSLDFAMTYSFWPWRFLTLIAPDIFGNPVTGDYWGYGYYWEDAIYIGLLPLIFAMVEVFSFIRRKKETKEIYEIIPRITSRPHYRNSFVVFLLLVIILSFMLALGNNTPIFPWLYKNILTFSMFQAPTRFTIWAEFALVLLAALGVDAWSRPGAKSLYWVRLGTAGAFAVAITAGFVLLLAVEINPTFIRAAALTGLFGLVIGVLTLTNPRQSFPQDGKDENPKISVWRWAVILFVALDLIIAGWGFNPGIDTYFFTEPAPTASQVKDLSSGLRLYLPADDEYSLKYDRFKRGDSFNPGEDWINLRAVMLPNLSMLDRIPSANNFDPLVPGRYARWMGALEDVQDSVDESTYARLLNLMAIGVVEIKDPSDEMYGIRLIPVSGSSRIRWVSCARVALDAEDAWVQVFEGQTDFEKAVVLEDFEYNQASDCLRNTSESDNAVSIHTISENPNRLDLQVNTTSSGWLVLSDVWYPGWHAVLDGDDVPIIRANYLFRAIYMNPGDHELTFNYRPFSFWIGFSVSVFAWILLVTGLWIGKKLYGASKD